MPHHGLNLTISRSGIQYQSGYMVLQVLKKLPGTFTVYPQQKQVYAAKDLKIKSSIPREMLREKFTGFSDPVNDAFVKF